MEKGMFLYNPKTKQIIKIKEIYPDRKRDGSLWFGYDLVSGEETEHFGYGKHNGWDYLHVIEIEWKKFTPSKEYVAHILYADKDGQVKTGKENLDE